MLDTMSPCIDNFVSYVDKIAEAGDSFDAKEYLNH